MTAEGGVITTGCAKAHTAKNVNIMVEKNLNLINI
jgi:hypothetical protein